MRIRTKVWLLVTVSVVLTAAATYSVRTYLMRKELEGQSVQSGREVAAELVDVLERLDADTSDMELASIVQNYQLRHGRIQRVQLLVDREATPSFRIVARSGERPEIDLFGAGPNRQAQHEYFSNTRGIEGTLPIELPVELKGPWKGTLTIYWDVGAVRGVIRSFERWTIQLGAANLVLVLILIGFITDRVVVRRLESLSRAMRDVEGGNLARRVPVDGDDEVGRLSQGFNRMLEQLSSADAEIRAFSHRLADEIDAATQDLSKKNVALAQLNRLLNELRRDNASRVRLATLGQLAAQLAHEIGTPLSSVSGHLQLALLQRELPAGLRDRLEVASREIGRIGRIVRDYLDSTRSLEPEKKPTSLARVVDEAVEVTRSAERGDPPVIDVHVAEDPSDFVTDPGLLRQIVINLLTNACDAVERGGRVALSAGSEGEDVVITVNDTGAGISAEDLRRIFEPFYTTKGRGKGTGLGLAICRELVAALGGTITVESTPGQGSAFTVRMPRQGQQGAPDGSESRPRAVAAGGTA
jgi:two-component system, NtrC family, sensor kinase